MNVVGGEVRGFKKSTGLKSKGPPKRALRTLNKYNYEIIKCKYIKNKYDLQKECIYPYLTKGLLIIYKSCFTSLGVSVEPPLIIYRYN